MFSPRDQELERGWPGRIEGDTVIQLAAQTLQAFFTGGGNAREHAVYPLPEVVFRAPVLRPPSIRRRGSHRHLTIARAARWRLRAAFSGPVQLQVIGCWSLAAGG